MALDRRKVTMVSISAGAAGEILRHQAEDYVAVEHLEEYVADARTRWQAVSVGEEIDHGPAGADGHYDVVAATTAPKES